MKDINMTEQQIKSISKKKFKKLVKKKINDKAFCYLQSIKNSHSKVKDLKYSENKMQSYIMARNLTIEQKQLLFQLRTNMVDVKENFKGQYLDTKCVLGCNEDESQFHLLHCTMIIQHCTQLYHQE